MLIALIVGAFYLIPRLFTLLLGFTATLVLIKFFKISFKIVIVLVILILVSKYI